jgi:cytochrome c biogenesis protein CcmG/thiol:disulfide interchange protein DsbE
MQRKAFMAIILALGVFALGCSSGTPDDVEAQLTDQPVPEFSLPDLDGAQFTNGDLDGKVALINFWATWCGPCKIEMPWFVEFQRKYKDQGFTVLAISLDEGGWDPVRTFAEAMEFNFPVALGGDPVSEDFGGIYVLPTTLIVDRSGKIVFRHSGLIPKAKYETEIESLL